METNDSDIVLIEQYLLGELDPETQREVEQRIAADKNFAAKTEEMQLVIFMAQTAQKTAHQAAIRQAEAAYFNDAQKTRKKALQYFFAAASLTLLILVGAWFIFLRPSQEKRIFEAEFKPLINYLAVKGDTQQAAFRLYDQRKYTEAILLFEQVTPDDSSWEHVQVYLGISLLADNRANEGLKVFTQYLKATGNSHRTTLLYYQVKWYQALAYLALEEKNKAIEALQILSKNPRAAHHKSAIRIVKQLE